MLKKHSLLLTSAQGSNPSVLSYHALKAYYLRQANICALLSNINSPDVLDQA